MSYDVGQVLYTIIKDKQIVVPVQVVEQIVIKDLNGEVTNYKVLLPNKKSQKVDIEKLENIFLDLDEVNDYLLKKAKESIDKMIEDAMTLEEEFFIEEKKEKIKDNFECKNESNNVIINKDQKKIILENGQTANIIDNTGVLSEELLKDDPEIEEENESSTA